MDLNRVMNLVFLIVITHCVCCYCVAYKFSVGGRDGWVIHPSEDYSHWSSRNRFLVNDTLLFNYKNGEDSVLEVTKDDYYNCNTSHWLFKNENGSSEFKLARSGPFFFISGVKDHCDKGQKLLLIVLSEKHRLAASPAAHPPAMAPSIALSPSTTTEAPSPVLLSLSPEVSPAPATSEVASPGPSVEPSSPPPGSSAEEIPPVPVPVASQKAAASAMDSALPILTCLMIVSNLFLRAIM